MKITFPLKNLIKISLGKTQELASELSNASLKRIAKIHFWTFMSSVIITFIASFVHYGNFLAVPELQVFTDTLNVLISPGTIFFAYLPATLLFFIFFLIMLFVISLLFFGIARAFKSQITLNTAIYSVQLLGIFYVFFQVAKLLMFSSTQIPILFSLFSLLYMLLMLYLIFRISRAFAEVSGVSTLTFLVALLLIITIFTTTIYFYAQNILSQLPLDALSSQISQIPTE
ncbi:MAG: hypothetical protein QF460_02790 [Candidatus Nanoarchaeia archaeon]|jgi:hypothetical protein|nr:hypothetical protein [Candidatus Nanoarchaeia archaeon]|tara:strand:- start:1533 stop:2219 length:687 start_codon:yes stop_codon:yes gene_type:complete